VELDTFRSRNRWSRYFREMVLTFTGASEHHLFTTKPLPLLYVTLSLLSTCSPAHTNSNSARQHSLTIWIFVYYNQHVRHHGRAPRDGSILLIPSDWGTPSAYPSCRPGEPNNQKASKIATQQRGFQTLGAGALAPRGSPLGG